MAVVVSVSGPERPKNNDACRIRRLIIACSVEVAGRDNVEYTKTLAAMGLFHRKY